jgi:hypothetical protein
VDTKGNTLTFDKRQGIEEDEDEEEEGYTEEKESQSVNDKAETNDSLEVFKRMRIGLT